MALAINLRGGGSGPVLEGGAVGDVVKKNADGTVSFGPGGGGGAVESVFGRDGVVEAQTNDYNASQVFNDSFVTGENVAEALNTLSGLALPEVTTDDDGDLLQVVGGVWAKSSPGFAISSFSYDGPGVGGVVLLGASVVSPPFSAAYSQPPTVATLTDNNGNPPLDVSSTPTSFNAPHSYTKTVFGQSVTWSLNASRGGNTAPQVNASLSWGQLNYHGAAVDPGAYTQAFIKSLGSLYPVLSPNGTYSANPGVGEYEFFCTRTAYGLTALDFTVLGLPFAITKVAAAVSVTNGNGIAENYDVWRSDNTGLGAFNYVVS